MVVIRNVKTLVQTTRLWPRGWDLYFDICCEAEQKKFSVSGFPTDPNFKHSIKFFLFDLFVKLTFGMNKLRLNSHQSLKIT